MAVSELRRTELAGLIGLSQDEITVVPNGVDAHQFLGLQAQSMSFLHQLNLFAAEPLLLMPVRITRARILS